MKSMRLLSVSMMLTLCAVPAVFGGTIISSTGTPDINWTLGGGGQQVVEAAWSATGGYSNVSISAEVGDNNLVGSSITAFLTNAIGPSETVANQLATVTFVPLSNDEVDTLFSGLTLGAGNYYLVLDDLLPTEDAAWWGIMTGGATITTDGGVTFGGEGFDDTGQSSPTNQANPPASVFVAQDLGLMFQVTGDAVSATPEPGSVGLMLVAGLAGFGLWKRRRSAIAPTA